MARGIAAFALLLLLQAASSVTSQTPQAATWWNSMFLWLFLALVAAFAVASVRGRGLTPIAGTLALLVLAGLALWPLAVPQSVPENFGTPWLWSMINVGAAWSAYAFGARKGCLYTLIIGGVFSAVRTTPQGGSGGWLIALEDATFATVLGLIICVAIGILRRAAERADTAADTAIEHYREAASATALSNERLRLDGLLHDSVMTALLTAAHAGSSEERSASSRLAQSALTRLDQQATEASESTPAAVAEIAARIRFTVGSGTAGAIASVTCESPKHLLLPADVVRAVLEATTEAVQNAARHSGANRCDVSITGNRTDGRAKLRVSIKDTGSGFDPGSVSDRRLGIKVSIVGRMEAVGGTAKIITAPRAGTEVRLGWEGVEP
ncbi:hypothetical protein AU252_15640 [Pseudarthrobacter sulfonivorans]|uniref:Histidine kinase/HSP90-like ATPase domain-containing protein n=1 Tax=Pseudarthrobacter sulfonivorans TaxID=121292 RepID=A0A0U3QS36_9MICC|nr:ATP-binding protein [Pseudarthrobacter sulfonivorans]ALV42405.1 hypothetical protein AU252_15640 [Pseudarthrobacter sulfonivorans]